MRRTVTALAAAALLAAAAPAALAATGYPPGSPSSTVVSTAQAASGTRMLYVQNLDGSDLQSMSLAPGVPSAFRVSVVDSGLAALSNAGFTVNSVLNNLYQVNGSGYTFGTFIPSQDVSVNDPTATLNALGVGLTDVPTLNVAGAIDSCSTLATNSTLISLLGAVSALSPDVALADLAPALCGTSGVLLSGLTIGSGSGDPIPTLTDVSDSLTATVSNLSALSQLPFSVAADTATSTAYNPADFSNGIGKGQGPGGAATVGGSQQLLAGSPVLSSGLLSALGMPADGTVENSLFSGITTATDIENALQALATTNTTAAALLSGLQQLDISLGGGSAGTQGVDQVLGSLTGTVNNTLANLSAESGTYTAIPSLTVSPPTGTKAGQYQGTLTVTMVQQ